MSSAPVNAPPPPVTSKKDTEEAITPGFYGILVAVFFTVLSIFVLFSTGSVVAVLVVWLLIILIVLILVYYGFLDIVKIMDQLFPEKTKPAVAPAPATTKPSALFHGSEVFHIDDAQFVYDDAQAVCAAYGGTVATLEQVMEAYNKGAEWCGYGWSAGGMALYPTQKTTWDELQREVDPGKRTRCGRPGVNGGYFDPSNKFGVNCFGFKPEGKFTPPAPVPGTDSEAFRRSVNRFKEMLKSFSLSPFSRNEWSGYDNTAAKKVDQYGQQFQQNIGKLSEGFDNADTTYVEAAKTKEGAAYTAGPYGLKGDTGEKGASGPAGAQGTPGAQGPFGPQGPPGALGPRGLEGTPGAIGPRGEQGIQGGKGDKGDKGDKGLKGDTGLQGVPGTAGSTVGVVGEKGAKGDKGDAGIQGLKGDKGPQGPIGITGLTGPGGSQGPKGDVGPQGAQGVIPYDLGHKNLNMITMGQYDIYGEGDKIVIKRPGKQAMQLFSGVNGAAIHFDGWGSQWNSGEWIGRAL